MSRCCWWRWRWPCNDDEWYVINFSSFDSIQIRNEIDRLLHRQRCNRQQRTNVNILSLSQRKSNVKQLERFSVAIFIMEMCSPTGTYARDPIFPLEMFLFCISAVPTSSHIRNTFTLVPVSVCVSMYLPTCAHVLRWCALNYFLWTCDGQWALQRIAIQHMELPLSILCEGEMFFEWKGKMHILLSADSFQQTQLGRNRLPVAWLSCLVYAK